MIAVLMRSWALAAAKSKAPPPSQQTSVWAIVVAVGVILGLLAAVLQLSGSATGWRYRKAQRYFLEQSQKVVEAQDAKRQVEEYRTQAEIARGQVEEARQEGVRAYLEARSAALQDQIASDVTLSVNVV